MGYRRRCSRPSCTRHAGATLTYIYSESTAGLGPLSDVVEPHGYDLCGVHADRLTAPRGWELIRITVAEPSVSERASDMEALADAVREEVRASVHNSNATAPGSGSTGHSAQDQDEEYLAGAVGEGVQRGHLRSIPVQLPGFDL